MIFLAKRRKTDAWDEEDAVPKVAAMGSGERQKAKAALAKKPETTFSGALRQLEAMRPRCCHERGEGRSLHRLL